jgi:peptidoglycan hydrolase-like protein with peptidoglycan-binding domain
VKDCIVGLGRFESANAATDKLKGIYFANKGDLVAVWTNPCSDADDAAGRCANFDPPASKCMQNLDTDKGTCRRIEVPASGKKKTACLDTPPPIIAAAFAPQAEGAPFAFADPGTAAGGPGPSGDDGAELVGLAPGDGLAFGTFDRRPRVESLQTRLNDRRNAGIGVDGKYGNATKEALRNFQLAAGLTPNPVVDEDTATALGGSTPVSESTLVGLQRGDGLVFGTFARRPRVSRLQSLLGVHGFPTKVDGMFGPLTGGALTGFQESVGLPPAELVDGETADALEGRRPICVETPDDEALPAPV